MRWKVLLAMGTALIIIVSWTAIHGRATQPSTDQATEKLVVRLIGHQLLLQAGDSSSRILPVEELAKREYLIRFAAPFTFVPDTLATTIRQIVAANGLPSSYLVEVIHCAPSGEVIFGFRIYKDSTRNVIACMGRRQERACYNIRIRFTESQTAGMAPFSSGLLAGSLAVILLGVLCYALYVRKRSAAQNIQTEVLPDVLPEQVSQELPALSGIAIGTLLFLPESQQLIAGSTITQLTAKEAKLLHVFANAQQEMIDRDQLMKEVWEDEGVIVGRSLDMFVSKLRKKLLADPRVSILNVHGKGYKLVIDQMAC